MVTAKEPRPTLVTRKPFINPQRVPTAMQIRIASQIGAPCAYDQPSIEDPSAKIDATERSISPVIIRKMTPKAMIVISLVLEKICETLMLLKKLSVVSEAAIQTVTKIARIEVSQVRRNLNFIVATPFPLFVAPVRHFHSSLPRCDLHKLQRSTRDR